MKLKFTEPDLYGYIHPIETDTIMPFYAKAMKKEMDKIPLKDKKIWTRAQKECPKLISFDNHMIMFLRCTLFDPVAAAARVVKYWQERFDLFGEKAFRKLTIDKILNEITDDSIFPFGFYQLLPGKDSTGRSIIFVEVKRYDKTKCTPDQFKRCAWYTIHAALENVEAQRKGIVYILSTDGMKYSQFNFDILANHIGSIKNYLPMRLTCIHIYNLPRFLNFLIPLGEVALGSQLLKNYSTKNKKKEKFDLVLKELSRWSLVEDILPNELGGKVVVDHASWIEKRKLIDKESKSEEVNTSANLACYKLICIGSF